ncbi:tetratricopeptide repeat protein [Mariprofundus micogutta]|uniref:Tetratricopeptide repeat protein n=1 Tax=Mariprofundus micogutta TaxID=1921010 RepID=A0A1L8CPM4_9PROT|nr:PA2778 family cysteine peptidase [Mariprofundus micogutta]GAV20876.1 tetratricopeptide repeat protein [Mariprofundus micogutta]
MPIKTGHRTRLIAGVFLACLLFSGCMPKQTANLVQEKPVGMNSSAKIESVPFFPQQDFQCGPAALAMALGHAGVAISPEQLRPELYIPNKRGSLQIEMLATPRRYGMLAYKLAPSLNKLLLEIQSGHPVIVFQNLGLSLTPQWHYAVATGFDLSHQTITLHSGDSPDYVMPLSTFENTWVRADSWAMLVLPAGKLPASADEKVYLRAVSSLEKADFHPLALKSYVAASKRWPDSLAARMGLGNSQYALGKLQQAQQTFLKASRDYPDAAEAFNNLAQTYLDQQNYDRALQAIQRAIEIDSSSALYHQTWAEIEQQKNISPQHHS